MKTLKLITFIILSPITLLLSILGFVSVMLYKVSDVISDMCIFALKEIMKLVIEKKKVKATFKPIIDALHEMPDEILQHVQKVYLARALGIYTKNNPTYSRLSFDKLISLLNQDINTITNTDRSEILQKLDISEQSLLHLLERVIKWYAVANANEIPTKVKYWFVDSAIIGKHIVPQALKLTDLCSLMTIKSREKEFPIGNLTEYFRGYALENMDDVHLNDLRYFHQLFNMIN